MRKIIKKRWQYLNCFYRVGDSLNENWDEKSIYPIVWFKNKLYTAMIKPNENLARICLWDIYDKNKKPYWTTIDKVYQVIKEE